MKKIKLLPIITSTALLSVVPTVTSCSLFNKTEAKYTVTFVIGDASAPKVETQTIISGLKAVRPEVKWTDHEITDWYTDTERKNLYDFSKPVTSNLTLYAKYSVTPTEGIEQYFEDISSSNTTATLRKKEGIVLPTSIIFPKTFNGKNILYFANSCFKDDENIQYIDLTNCTNLTNLLDSCFENCINLKQIVGPSIVNICKQCFKGCTKLEYALLPNAVISESSFENCSSLLQFTTPSAWLPKNVFKNCSSLTTITANKTDAIFESAFDGCTSLSTINIDNDSCYKIEQYAFRNCSSLTKFIIPKYVASIGQEAFDGCTKLETLSLSDYTNTIGGNCFKNCDKLSSVYIGDTITSWTYGQKTYTPISPWASGNADFLKSICDDGAQKNETKVNGIKFSVLVENESIEASYDATTNPDSNVVIPQTAFISAGKITLPIVSLKSECFKNRDNINMISLPNTITSIGSSAFEDCKSLININIPTSVKNIYTNTFKGCENLTSIELPNDLTTIGEYAFQGSAITSIVIPSKVTSIGAYAFQNCTDLIYGIVSPGVTKLSNYMFDGCTSLTSVILPSTINSIDALCQNTFDGCSALTSAYIGSNTLLGLTKEALESDNSGLVSKLSTIIVKKDVTIGDGWQALGFTTKKTQGSYDYYTKG